MYAPVPGQLGRPFRIACPRGSGRLAASLALALSVLLALTTLAGANGQSANVSVTFASGPSWSTFAADPASTPGTPPFGAAQNVCLNAFAPPSCPAGAANLGSGFFAWLADLAPIPGATWVWAPGTTGATSPADLARFFFSKTFVLTGRPVSGTVYVAVDDFAAVHVNGTRVGTIGSIVSPDVHYNHLTAFDITSLLVAGGNVITVEAQNGPASFAGCFTCSYAQNPAGVVFGGSITTTSAPTATVNASGAYGSAPGLSGVAPGNPAIAYTPADAAPTVTGTLTCTTTATAASPPGVYPITGCSGLQSGGSDVAYDLANSGYTVTPAPLTVSADSKTRLFGAANPTLTATLSGFVLGQSQATSGVTGAASCTTTATPFSAGGTYPITCGVGTLAATNYSFATFVPGTLTVTHSQPCLTGSRSGPLTVAAGQSLCLGPGAVSKGALTVQPGGALEIRGSTITGALRSTGAVAVRLCGSTLTGPIQITGTIGLVLVGGDAATGPCDGNMITGATTVNANQGGVELNGNTIDGALTVTGNTGNVPPPHAGPVHAAGNTVTGATRIQT